jgi:hypothetical protein
LQHFTSEPFCCELHSQYIAKRQQFGWDLVVENDSMSNLGMTYDRSFARNTPASTEKLTRHAAENAPVTVRQLFYAVLTTGLISKTDDGKIGRLVAKLRREGDIPWDQVTDGSRDCHEPAAYRTLMHGVAHLLPGIRVNPWADKPVQGPGPYRERRAHRRDRTGHR